MITTYVGIVDGMKTWEVRDDQGNFVGTNQCLSDDPPPPPDTVTASQIRKWLVAHDISLDSVDAAIAALPEEVRVNTQIEWEFEPLIHRSSSMLAQMAASFGMDSAAIDAAFIEAASL
jgi:hypothetical protein